MANLLWDAVARSEPTGEDITANRERTAQAAEARETPRAAPGRDCPAERRSTRTPGAH